MGNPTAKICINITDQDGVLLDRHEIDVVAWERLIASRTPKAGKGRHEAETVALLVARDLTQVGQPVADLVYQEVRAALVRRANARKAGR